MVITLQSVDEMLKCDSSSDVIEHKCSRWNETVPEILCAAVISVQLANPTSPPYHITGCLKKRKSVCDNAER